jgi:hypothetical protein
MTTPNEHDNGKEGKDDPGSNEQKQEEEEGEFNDQPFDFSAISDPESDFEDCEQDGSFNPSTIPSISSGQQYYQFMGNDDNNDSDQNNGNDNDNDNDNEDFPVNQSNSHGLSLFLSVENPPVLP